jgi:hypothetical protein
MKIIGSVQALKLASFSSLVVLALAGCAGQAPAPTKTPIASATSTPSASATPSPTLPAAMTPAEAKAAYRAIAKSSCNKAQAEGVVETDGDYTIVMVNKNDAYKDYSAAYLQGGKYVLVWEISGLASCSDWYTLSMAEEAGQEAAIDVVFNTTDSSFTATQDLGEFGISNIKYTVANGLIATSTNLDPKHPATVTVRYGNITEDDRKIIITAVDEFLAAQ